MTGTPRYPTEAMSSILSRDDHLIKYRLYSQHPNYPRRCHHRWCSRYQFITAAVAEKIVTLSTVDEFLKERAGDSVPAYMLAILDQMPDTEPMEGDEPPG